MKGEEENFVTFFRALVAKFEDTKNPAALILFYTYGLLYLRSCRLYKNGTVDSAQVNPRRLDSMDSVLNPCKAVYFNLTQARVLKNEEKIKIYSQQLQKIGKQMEHVIHMSTILDPKHVLSFATVDKELTGTAVFGAIFRSSPDDLFGE
jgi:D-alanyl-lipoteichoic acid acyltransferase DltB (MBOAT superfamily)